MSAFKKGDLVRLKSGGPTMVIDACPGDESGHSKSSLFGSEQIIWNGYCCRWFAGDEPAYDEFGGHLLELVQD